MSAVVAVQLCYFLKIHTFFPQAPGLQIRRTTTYDGFFPIGHTVLAHPIFQYTTHSPGTLLPSYLPAYSTAILRIYIGVYCLQ